ncbi:MAG: DUF551 domain-containing protein [Marinomonas gallaica]
MSEWISVEDKLPEVRVNVLIYEKYTSVPVVAYRTEYGDWCASTEAYDTNGDAIVVDNLIQEDITHWMPLPKPPKAP